MAVALFISFGVLVFLNVPVGFALGVAGLTALLVSGDYPLVIMSQRMFTAMDSFALMAIPFYILAGGLMDSGGMSVRIVRFASTLVGHLRGGLSMVAVVSSMFFAGVSGSAVADTAAIGSVLIPSMNRRGYDPAFSGALVAAAGIMGPVIPPSIPMVLYGVLAGVSIGTLFVAGILPGILIALVLMCLAYWEALRRGHPREPRATLRATLTETRHAAWALIMPVIVLGGILSGVFTATEAGVAAVLYAFFVGKFVYKELQWSQIPRVLNTTVIATAVVMLLVSASTLFGWLMTVERIPQTIAATMTAWSSSIVLQLVVINVVLILAGTFLDVAPGLILTVPVLLPLATALGIDPIHFGIIVIVNMVIGLITPPVAPTLVVAANIARISLDRITMASWKFLFSLLLVLVLVTYIPGISLWLPRLIGK